MAQPELIAAKDLSKHDVICVPGLATARFPIKEIFEDGTDIVISTNSADIRLPNAERKVWAIKRENLFNH